MTLGVDDAPHTEDPAPGAGVSAPAVPVEVAASPRWERPALGALLVVTAVTYLWNVDRVGWGNTYYSAAVQAATQSWKAFFFGSLDAGNFITVDKPPVSLWFMDLSARVFGLNTWSLLVPQVLMGVASVWLLHLTVRRAWGPGAGLLAGLALAVTPAATLMFRYDNPDAALTLLLVAAGYAVVRAVDGARLRWLLLSGVLLGLAFLTKELQALVPLPAMALAYLLSAPTTLWTRVRHLLLAGVALVVSGGWWIALVELLPPSARPYVGGSNTNSILEILWGYNGLGRITGNEAGGPVGGGGVPAGGAGFGGGRPGGGSPFGGTPGLFRLANEQFAGMASWLVPAALVGLVATVYLLRGARRTDPRMATAVLWGGWMLVTGAVFSYGSGVIHPYYAVALAPGVAACAAMAAPALWHRRAQVVPRLLLATSLAATAVTGFLLLGRAASVAWVPPLRWTVLVAGLVVAVLIWLPVWGRAPRGLAAVVAALAVVCGLVAPTAWSLSTLGRAESGGDPSPGPVRLSSFGGPGGPGGAGGFGGQGGGFQPPAGFQPPTGAAGGQGGPGQQGQPGQQGGPGGGGTADAALVALLKAVPSSYTWAAAASSSMTQGSLQLGSGRAVMALGGFGGGDPAITLDGFKALVGQGKVRYFIGGGGFGGGFGGGPGGGGGANDQIQTWVSVTFPSTTVGSSTVYDLAAPK